jgi:hypothetical protein
LSSTSGASKTKGCPHSISNPSVGTVMVGASVSSTVIVMM